MLPPGVRAPQARLAPAATSNAPVPRNIDDLLAAHRARGSEELPAMQTPTQPRPKITWRPTAGRHARLQHAQQETHLKLQAILDIAFEEWAARHGF